MKTLTIALLITLSACSTTKPTSTERIIATQAQPDELPVGEVIDCQVKLFKDIDKIVDEMSIFYLMPYKEVKRTMRVIKHRALHCYREKSINEQAIDDVLGSDL